MTAEEAGKRPVQGPTPNPNPNPPGPPRNPEEGPIDVQELLAKIGAKDISLGKVRNSYENLYQAFMQVQQENSRLQVHCADLEGKLKVTEGLQPEEERASIDEVMEMDEIFEEAVVAENDEEKQAPNED